MKHVLVAASCLMLGLANPGSAADQSFDLVERGRNVAIAADCVACHTAPGGRPWAGGLVLKTPFGNLASPNITPESATGLGRYSEADLRRALRDGLGQDGKRLYPAMPYPSYSKMTDDEIHALWAYMSTLEPVVNKVEVNQLPFPFNIRFSLLGWNMINFWGPQPFVSDSEKSAQGNRGAYLVAGPGHCGACHTPKNLLGGEKSGQLLEGANLNGWVAPNITSDARKGIGSWSSQQIVEYLKTGGNHQAIASGPMAEAIANSTSQMPDSDLMAIAAYLLGTKAQAAAANPLPAGNGRMQVGAGIYKDTCAACHGDDGAGAAHLFPQLMGNPALQQEDAATLIRVVLEGARGVATDARPTAPGMPALGWRLSDDEIASVVTYIRNSWGNAAPAVGSGDVTNLRKSLAVQ